MAREGRLPVRTQSPRKTVSMPCTCHGEKQGCQEPGSVRACPQRGEASNSAGTTHQIEARDDRHALSKRKAAAAVVGELDHRTRLE